MKQILYDMGPGTELGNMLPPIPVEGSERSNIEDRRGGELAVVDEESEETFEEALEDEHNDDVRFVEDI